MGKKKVFIYRRNWRTGGDTADGIGCHGSGPTRLRNKLDYHCCLGFILAQTRPELSILDKDIPESCGVDIAGLTANVTGRQFNTRLTWAAIALNDNPNIGLAEREDLLRALFKFSPYELEFVGEYNERKD
jgi:hypothetical protein